MQCATTLVRQLIFGCLLLFPAVLHAEQPRSNDAPEWQFKSGQALRWTFENSVKMEFPQGNIAVQVILDLDVDVTAVEQEIATLAISTSRIRVSSDLPDDKTSYDSATGGALKAKSKADTPNDQAKPKTPSDDDDNDDSESGDGDLENIGRVLMAKALAPVLELKYTVKLNKHCVVQSIEIDRETLDEFRTGSLQSFLILVDKDGFSSAYAGGFIRMDVERRGTDQTWRSKVVSNSSTGFGTGTFEHSFRRDGTAQINGREFQKFASTAQMALDLKNRGQFKLGKQSGTGVIYFDQELGRVAKSEWTLSAEVFLNGGTTKGKMTIETKSQITDRETPK